MTELGIDIGLDSISLVETARTMTGRKLLNFAVRELPWQPSGAAVTEALSDLISSIELHSKKAKISVWGDNIRAQFVRLPRLAESELLLLIKNHFDKLVPFPPSECIVDVEIINNEPDNNMNVLIVSSRKEHIASRITQLNDCGLVPAMICTDGMALQKLFVSTKQHNPSKNYVILNITRSKATLVILKHSYPFFMTDLVAYGDIKTLAGKCLNIIETETEKHEAISIDEIYLSGDMSIIKDFEKYIHDNGAWISFRWSPVNELKDSTGLSHDNAVKLTMALAISNA